jgi:DNA-binding CsgD family transcriptional regulator
MAMSQSIGGLAVALRAAQAEFPNVKKDRQGYGYKYADLSSCLEAVREPLSKNGLSIVQFPSSIDGKQFLVTQLMHDSGEYISGEYLLDTSIPEKSKMNTCQAMGSSLTYARRYSLAAMVGLAQEDDDAASTSPQPKQELSDSQKIVVLCKKAGISPKEFADFFNISSDDLESVKNAIAKFDDMAEQFLKSKNANSQTVN